MIQANNDLQTIKSLNISSKRAASFHLYEKKSFGRSKAEYAVSKIFRSAYGADITSYLPYLLTAEVNQRIAAVVGVRCAAEQPLFLEQYLSTNVEAAIKQINGLIIPRQKIVEIGDMFAVETRGLWKTVGDFMGGPFLSYTIYDEANDQIIVVEGMVYGPDSKKRNVLFELEVMMRSIETE